MREKQRRSDLSSAFEELSQFIAQVEPQGMTEEDPDFQANDKKKRRKSIDGADDSNGVTRLDLIGRAVRIMKRLHRENEERKQIIASYEAHGGGAVQQPSDNVLVMVPSLAPVAEDHPVARASYPPTAYHHSYPHHSAAAAAQPYHPLSAASAAGIADHRSGYDMNAAHLQHHQHAYHMGYGRPQHPAPPGALLHSHSSPPHPHYMGVQHSPQAQHHQLSRSGMSPTASGMPHPPSPHPGGHQ
jgi:hypothetical protein